MSDGSESKFAWASRVTALTVSRATLQIASLAIIFILGRLDPQILAMVALGLALSGIGFAIITSIPLGIQPELSRRLQDGKPQVLKLVSALLVTVALLAAAVAIAYLFLAEMAFSQAADNPHFHGAIAFAKVLALSMPLVGMTTLFWICIELIGKASIAARYRAIQASTQIAVVLLCLGSSSAQGAELAAQVALMYFGNDLVYFFIIGRLFWNITGWRGQRFGNDELSVLGKISIALTAGAIFDRSKGLLLTSIFASISAAAVAAYSLGMAMIALALIPFGGMCAGLAMEVSSQSQVKSRRWIYGLGTVAIGSLLVVSLVAGWWPEAIAKDARVATLISSNSGWFCLTFLAEGLLMLSLSLSRGLGVYFQSQLIYWLLVGASLATLCLSTMNFTENLAIVAAMTLSAALLILFRLNQIIASKPNINQVLRG